MMFIQWSNIMMRYKKKGKSKLQNRANNLTNKQKNKENLCRQTFRGVHSYKPDFM